MTTKINKNNYTIYNFSKLTKSVLDNIEVGDYIKCNDWKKPMIVVATSPNYFIAIQRHFKTYQYTICEKLPKPSTHNFMYEGHFTIGPDNYYCYYDYYKLDECEEALIRLEDSYNYTPICDKNVHPNYYDWEKFANKITLDKGTLEIGRHGITLNKIAIKKTKWNKNNIEEYLDKHFSGVK